jgi:hypothetical protein
MLLLATDIVDAVSGLVLLFIGASTLKGEKVATAGDHPMTTTLDCRYRKPIDYLFSPYLYLSYEN